MKQWDEDHSSGDPYEHASAPPPTPPHSPGRTPPGNRHQNSFRQRETDSGNFHSNGNDSLHGPHSSHWQATPVHPGNDSRREYTSHPSLHSSYPQPPSNHAHGHNSYPHPIPYGTGYGSNNQESFPGRAGVGNHDTYHPHSEHNSGQHAPHHPLAHPNSSWSSHHHYPDQRAPPIPPVQSFNHSNSNASYWGSYGQHRIHHRSQTTYIPWNGHSSTGYPSGQESAYPQVRRRPLATQMTTRSHMHIQDSSTPNHGVGPSTTAPGGGWNGSSHRSLHSKRSKSSRDGRR